MRQILKTIQENNVNYRSVIKRSKVIMKTGESYIRVIIPVRNRDDFIEPTIRSLNSWKGEVAITLVEHDRKLKHKNKCKKLGVDYIGIKAKRDEPFNKCLAFNVGVLVSGNSEWLLMHDVDCMVQDRFFTNLLKNAHRHRSGAIQSFNKRRVLYCTDWLSKSLIRGVTDVNDLNEDSDGIFTCEGKAPGGSIFIKRDLFFTVGGYDPELFHGYSPEDRFFWDKVCVFGEICSANNPITDIFHLHHEYMGNTNPQFKKMLKIANAFGKLGYINKCEVIKYKQEILSSWL